MPRCSVIIVTYNSGAHIEACLLALASQDCEIVVVDNASQDDTVARVQATGRRRFRCSCSRFRATSDSRGGVNQGARAASGDVLLILNPDAVAEAGAVDAILECMASYREQAPLEARCWRATASPREGFAFRRLPTLTALLFEVLLVNQVWPGNPVNRRYRCLDADYSKPQADRTAGGSMPGRHAQCVGLGTGHGCTVLPGLV